MKWVRARVGDRCAYGCTVVRGADVMLGKRRFVVCAACAEQRYGQRPPPRPEKVERDGKAMAIRNDE